MKNLKHAAILAGMASRLTALNGCGVDPAATAGLAEQFKTAAATGGEPMMLFNGNETKVGDVMTMARQKVPEAITALNALRMENIDLYMRATLDFSLLYETITLAPNEQACIEHSYTNPTNVRYAGQDGGVRGVKAVKARKQVFVDMREMHSDSVGYQMRDIQQGNDIAAASQATVDMAWDMKHRVNVEMFNFLQGGVINGVNYGTGIYRAFNFTGKSLQNTGILHPGIQASNLPATNLITYSALSTGYSHATNFIDFTVLRAVIDYIESFRGVFKDGDLEATGAILCPSSDSTGLLAAINPTGAFYNKVGESVLNSFTKVEYGGRVWTLIGTPCLPKGACYPILNKKVGNYYVKPGYDFEHVESDVLKNWEERTGVKTIALAAMEPWRYNGLKIIYSNAAGAGVVNSNL